MSLERYFQRAHDEARQVARISERTGGEGVLYAQPRWAVALTSGDWCGLWKTRAAAAETAARDVLRHPLNAGTSVAWAARMPPLWLDGILDRAMADTDGSPTLAAGEGAEARRLLEMVAWDRVPQARWPEVFETLRMAVAWRKAGCASWLATTRAMLAEDGWLAEAAERSAA